MIAALLRDTIEDTATTKEELIRRFGSDVADLVAEVTNDKSLPKAERKRLQIETAPMKSVRAQTIKIADKISNLRGILYSPPADWDYQHKKDYFTWAKKVVNGFTAPNPVLKTEFDATLAHFSDIVPKGPAKSADTSNAMWVDDTEPGAAMTIIGVPHCGPIRRSRTYHERYLEARSLNSDGGSGGGTPIRPR